MAGKLYILMGIPASGKSTFVKEHFKSKYTQLWVSRDEVRFKFVEEGEPYFSKEDEVFKNFTQLIDQGLMEGKDVFADATHLNKKSRAKLLRNLKIKPREVAVIWLQTQLKDCLERNELRKGARSYVPRSQLRRMAYSLEAPDLEDEGIDELYIVRPDHSIKMITREV